MNNPLSSFLICLTFFTRISLPPSFGQRIRHDETLVDAVSFFPVVGLIIGSVGALVWFTGVSFLPSTLAAGLAVLTIALLTGGLHEDGLADCADGFGATGDREKALDIMRDSRIGTYGSIALIFSIGLRWLALASLGSVTGLISLLIAHSASRSAISLAMKWSDYARPKGLGQLASGEMSDFVFVLSIAIPTVLALVLGQLAGLLAISGAFLAAWLFLQYLKKRLGGYTGDGLGAMQQISEITTMIILAGIWA